MDWSEGLSRVFTMHIMQWIVKIALAQGKGRITRPGMNITNPVKL